MHAEINFNEPGKEVGNNTWPGNRRNNVHYIHFLESLSLICQSVGSSVSTRTVRGEKVYLYVKPVQTDTLFPQKPDLPPGHTQLLRSLLGQIGMD